MKGKWEKPALVKGMPLGALVLCCLALTVLFPSGARNTAGMTEEEARIAATLSMIAGAGETRVSIYYEEAGTGFERAESMPAGAVIVAGGADRLEVRLRLLRAAETLLGLPAARVEVFAMEGSACGKE